MAFWNTAIRVTLPPTLKDHLRASGVTLVVPTAAAALLLWLVPSGCDIHVDETVFRWTCLLPGLLFTVSPAVALLLPFAMTLNRRLARPFPDGWLVTVLAVGVCAQAVVTGINLASLGSVYLDLFLYDVIFISQPFVAGAISGAVCWAALHW